MLTRRWRAFTLIELLVVIAIIGILAAMVFPVFARARESARKVVCLSNVKNIAMAIQMYLGDNNDTLFPNEHRDEVFDYLSAGPGGSSWECQSWPKFARWANPYLREPLILDEYVRNRDVWSCPSAKVQSAANFILPGPDWLGYLRATEGQWGKANADIFGPACITSWPPGWGGDVTDSIAQQRLAGQATGQRWPPTTGAEAHRAFALSICVQNAYLGNLTMENALKLAAVDDPVSYVIVVEGGVSAQEPNAWTLAAYPDLCCVGCAGIIPWTWGWPVLDANRNTVCPDGSYCPECWALHASYEWMRDPKAQKAAARHLGGDNLGFLDGHAKWLPAQSILNMGRDGDLSGLDIWGYGQYDAYVDRFGEPEPGMIFLY